MAKIAYEHLRTDVFPPDLLPAFLRVFNTSPYGANRMRDVMGIVRPVKQTYKAISMLQPIPRSAWDYADTHIYCDDDDRWKPQDDDKVSPDNALGMVMVPNSQRRPDKKVYEDESSSLLTIGTPTCRLPDMIAATYRKVRPSPPYREVPSGRSAITICKVRDKYASATMEALKLLGYFSIPELGIDELTQLLSFRLLHELTATEPMNRIPDERAITWQDVIWKHPTEAVMRSANYAFFGLLVLLDEWDYLLSNDHAESMQGILDVKRPESDDNDDSD
ncbi:hypothetical protein EJ05DRAFT_476835 [Pseudovirgaria hyperparasitica]|uniref:Uncharacterized protein n=1 Tax=Pseudovirgaria hyperparasitica TaxID=470096 RepID=A0A6A6W417_9PEZI|nr:uncharacterized protein EJ05DRAFT_476835 [Pseudovirgaria hyperparasitica]KAF2757602.1 hypothetical protein EJ05DRAFT_476835 [Pseudovirgaria hyperparasitica]